MNPVEQIFKSSESEGCQTAEQNLGASSELPSRGIAEEFSAEVCHEITEDAYLDSSNELAAKRATLQRTGYENCGHEEYCKRPDRTKAAETGSKNFNAETMNDTVTYSKRAGKEIILVNGTKLFAEDVSKKHHRQNGLALEPFADSGSHRPLGRRPSPFVRCRSPPPQVAHITTSDQLMPDHLNMNSASISKTNSEKDFAADEYSSLSASPPSASESPIHLQVQMEESQSPDLRAASSGSVGFKPVAWSSPFSTLHAHLRQTLGTVSEATNAKGDRHRPCKSWVEVGRPPLSPTRTPQQSPQLSPQVTQAAHAKWIDPESMSL